MLTVIVDGRTYLVGSRIGREFFKSIERHISDFLGAEFDVEFIFQRLFDVGAHQRVHTKFSERRCTQNVTRIFDTCVPNDYYFKVLF